MFSTLIGYCVLYLLKYLLFGPHSVQWQYKNIISVQLSYFKLELSKRERFAFVSKLQYIPKESLSLSLDSISFKAQDAKIGFFQYPAAATSEAARSHTRPQK